jgi:hypothetical protein
LECDDRPAAKAATVATTASRGKSETSLRLAADRTGLAAKATTTAATAAAAAKTAPTKAGSAVFAAAVTRIDYDGLINPAHTFEM